MWQYKKDRNPREKLFEFGRCVAHFAVDESEVCFCTHLQGKASWFLPFNRGWNDGAGNPPNPSGIKTNYLWREVLTRGSLTDILENYAQVGGLQRREDGQERKGPRSGPATTNSTWFAAPGRRRGPGAGRRYLSQHSAGTGRATPSRGWPIN